MTSLVELREEVAALLPGKIAIRHQHRDRPLPPQRKQPGELPKVIGLTVRLRPCESIQQHVKMIAPAAGRYRRSTNLVTGLANKPNAGRIILVLHQHRQHSTE